MQPVNEWIVANMDRARRYLEDLLDVPDPEDFLKVDRYIELTQKTKPVIIISYHEVAQTHELLHKHILSSFILPRLIFLDRIQIWNL